MRCVWTEAEPLASAVGLPPPPPPPKQHSLALHSILVTDVLWGCVGCIYRPVWPCRDASNAKIGPG